MNQTETILEQYRLVQQAINDMLTIDGNKENFQLKSLQPVALTIKTVQQLDQAAVKQKLNGMLKAVQGWILMQDQIIRLPIESETISSTTLPLEAEGHFILSEMKTHHFKLNYLAHNQWQWNEYELDRKPTADHATHLAEEISYKSTLGGHHRLHYLRLWNVTESNEGKPHIELALLTGKGE